MTSSASIDLPDRRVVLRPRRWGTSVVLALLLLATGGATAFAVGPGTGEFPDGWFYPDRRTGGRHAAPASLEGRKAPPLKLRDWIGKPQDLAKLEGKVVVVDFWATWCRPCMAAIPKNVKLVEKYGEQGLVVIGVHDARRGANRMPTAAKQLKINYPLAVDDGGVSTRQWKVAFWPTYAVVDHRGIVRAAGLAPNHVEKVVEKLLAEKKADDSKAAASAAGS